MVRKSTLWIWLVVAFAAAQGARHQIDRQFIAPFPPLTALVPTEHMATDVGALMTGAHRAAADIAYIQFLQYYGQNAAGHHHGHDHGEEEQHETFTEYRIRRGLAPVDTSDGGKFFKIQEFGRRILNLDPYFHTAILEVSGVLAFNLKRTDEALQLLADAIALDPQFYRYRLYSAAILYKDTNQDAKLIKVLAEAIQYPDCPPMVENVLGNLLKKYGYYADAAKVFKHTFDTGPQFSDRDTAYRNLMKLFHEHPEILPQIGFDPRQIVLK